jgi:hypothetical protein
MSEAENPTKPSAETPAGAQHTDAGADQVPFKRRSLIADFWEYLMENKKWWELPIIIGILLIMLLVAVGTPALLPFIYTLF